MSKNRHSMLYQIAREQRGLFTAGQAVRAGFVARNHAYHVRAGHWEKERRGIYRLKNFPFDPASEYVLWSLWSRNIAGEVQGVIAFETALRIYELSDISPPKIHMIVPKNFKKRAAIPEVLVLHKSNLEPEEWVDRGGYRITTPTRTLSDVIFARRISRDFVCQAIEEGTGRGLYPLSELRKYGIANLTQELLVKHGR